jgi:hypothetical protein
MSNVVAAQPTILDGEASVAAADLRRELTGATFPNAGVVRGLSVVAIPTPAMQVRLPAGLAMVDDGTGGFYPLSLLAQTDLDIAASDPALARYDSVIAEVVDTGSAGTLLRRFRVITGTPSGSPVPPTMPPADQASAKTLVIGRVFVQAAAETHGFIRAQDVTYVAPSAALVPRPVQSLQVTNLDTPTPGAGVWTDFSNAVWPPVTFTVPPSGMAHFTIGADTDNESSSTATTRVSFRLSGGTVQAANFGRDVGGHGTVVTSRRCLITGMTPGSSVTATPSYRMSTLSGTRYVHAGNLIVEPVA